MNKQKIILLLAFVQVLIFNNCGQKWYANLSGKWRCVSVKYNTPICPTCYHSGADNREGEILIIESDKYTFIKDTDTLQLNSKYTIDNRVVFDIEQIIGLQESILSIFPAVEYKIDILSRDSIHLIIPSELDNYSFLYSFRYKRIP